MKNRLDVYLTTNGLAETREKAKAIIMSGGVYVNGNRADKPGALINQDADVVIRRDESEYVSRGGQKLEKAIKCFGIDVTGMTAADIGASTGGFTDCLLKKGAKRVYAVDVGYGQLAWKLRNDPRVIVLERINARYLSEKEIPEKLDFFCADVSFISLKLIIPQAIPLLKDNASAVCLIKPQFEAGRDKVEKHGVVKAKSTHIDVLSSFLEFLRQHDIGIKGLSYSPLKGPKGNIEFLVHIGGNHTCDKRVDIVNTVETAHAAFGI